MTSNSVFVEDFLTTQTSTLRELSLQIHSNPELSGLEHKAHDLLADFLEARGFTVSRKACGLETGFLAEWSGRDVTTETVTIAFLSECDALPGIGHACGHNLIAISGVTAALSLQAFITKNNLNAKIKLFGTPAEETWGGKINFIQHGYFNGVDAALMVHPGNVNVTYAKYLALSGVYVEYHGKSAHAASCPWEGRNALDALIQSYNAMSMLRQQVLPTTRIHGIIKKGGDAANVIPAHTKGEFMIRTEKLADLNELIPKMRSIFESSAVATGTTVSITEDPTFEDVVVNTKLAERFEQYARADGCKFASKEVQTSKSYGSTDMGNVTHVVPGIHPVFDIECTQFDIHTNEFREGAATDTAHKATLRAAKCLCLTAIDVITDPEFRRQVHKEFEEAEK
ncbi:UNVERIFIED_CONTAM: hypothetical protein HDU68_008939 [Siphonaria sp. JEL0065]|nr:hypothetical protein HDU68_008939 [Siphonaria sp. JEL0065]